MLVISYLIFALKYSKKRVGNNGTADDFQCRKKDNLKISPNNTKHYYICLPNKYTPECILKLAEIRIIKHVNLIEGVPSGNFETDHDFLKPTRHIPPTNPIDGHNMSPVEGYTFAQLRSMQNVQSLLYSPVTNKYIYKYTGKMDENNRIVVSTNAHKNGKLIT